MDSNSLAHTKWDCKYSVIFHTEYRRQAIEKQISADIGRILRTLCTGKGIEINPSHERGSRQIECDLRTYSFALWLSHNMAL